MPIADGETVLHHHANNGVKNGDKGEKGGDDKETLLRKRQQTIGSTCQLFFASDPVLVKRASMQWVEEETGRRLLDCISNVQHVGHSHPRVTERLAAQIGKSTCNVRFVDRQLTEAAERLLATLRSPLDTVLFCNSGSEANDLALRLARDFTGHHDVIVLDHAYHGHVTTTMQMSPYKFKHGSSLAQPDWVHVAPCPDVYRSEIAQLADDELELETAQMAAGEKFGAATDQIIAQISSSGRSLAAFFAEALQSCGGQVLPPKGYFAHVAKSVHAAGGLFVMDEVQTGFGRIGRPFWAHRLHDPEFVPDILTVGKSMGNGFPVSAVVTRREIADRLGHHVGYFNTYGGNPVACAAVSAVLEVLEEENLVEHAHKMGDLWREALLALQAKHASVIGHVRGVGQFWGIDLVEDRVSRRPNTLLASHVVLHMRREHGVLVSSDGPHSNVIKFKPPLCFDEHNLRQLSETLDATLAHFTRQS